MAGFVTLDVDHVVRFIWADHLIRIGGRLGGGIIAGAGGWLGWLGIRGWVDGSIRTTVLGGIAAGVHRFGRIGAVRTKMRRRRRHGIDTGNQQGCNGRDGGNMGIFHTRETRVRRTVFDSKPSGNQML